MASTRAVVSAPLLLLLILPALLADRDPPTPNWPDQFTSNFEVRIGKYGPDWSSGGVVYYDYLVKVTVT